MIEVFTSILAILFILGVAYAIRKATNGTIFRYNCGCTPNIGKLKKLEDETEEQKKETTK